MSEQNDGSARRRRKRVLRASREHSRPSTIPALPSDTSATSRWNPSRSVGRGAGLALVDVDHDDPLGRPAERDRSAAQVVLAARGLGVVGDLIQAGLAHVQVRVAAEMVCGHLALIVHRVCCGDRE